MGRAVFENITLAHLKRHSLAGVWLTPRREKAFAHGNRTAHASEIRRSDATSVRVERRQSAEGRVRHGLVGGAPKLLLLEEPTRGVDVGAKFDIYAIMRELTAEGTAVILVSSDLPELLGISDRIAVMRRGTITQPSTPADLGEDDLINLCYGRASGTLVA